MLHTLGFYDGRCLDPSGGFFQGLRDDGTLDDPHRRDLVASARFVCTHAMAARHLPEHGRAAAWREAAAHGLRFLQDVHRQPDGHHAWRLRWDGRQAEVLDATPRAEGLAFVLLAQAHAALADVPGAREALAATRAALDSAWWRPDEGLYATEQAPDGTLSPYRAQRSNLRACEALLTAHLATGDDAHVERAAAIADEITGALAARTQGLVWEHHARGADGRWTPRLDGRDDVAQPWGFRTGHQAAWARLLLAIERARPEPDEGGPRVHRARALFAAAVQHGWDRRHGGLVHTFGPHGSPATDASMHVVDARKRHAVQAEALAAAAVLAERTAEGHYWDWYDRLWGTVWTSFVDHQHGGWHASLKADLSPGDDPGEPVGKADQRPIAACFEVLAVLER